MTGDEGLFSTIFRAILLCCFPMDNGYNIETCKIIGSTSLRLHILPYARFFRSPKEGRGGGHGPSGPMVNTPIHVTPVLVSSKYSPITIVGPKARSRQKRGIR